MSWLEWALGAFIVMLYIVCIFTVCSLTFQKGRTMLGILGIFMPFLWLIGAILPARPGSRFDVAMKTAYASQTREMTA